MGSRNSLCGSVSHSESLLCCKDFSPLRALPSSQVPWWDRSHSETTMQTHQTTPYPTNHTITPKRHRSSLRRGMVIPITKAKGKNKPGKIWTLTIFILNTFPFQMPFHYIYLIKSNKSNTINSITFLCLQLFKKKYPGPDAPILPSLTGSRCGNHKDLLVEEWLPRAVIHLHPCHGSWAGNSIPPPPSLSIVPAHISHRDRVPPSKMTGSILASTGSGDLISRLLDFG